MAAGTGNDDDAEVQLIAFQLFANGHGTFFVHEDFQVGVAALKAGEDFGKEVGTHHRWNTDFDGAFLELFIVVDLQYGILNIAQGQFYAIEKDGSLRSQGKLFLAAVKELNAQFCLQFFNRYGDVGLGYTEAFCSPGNISQTAGHLEIFKLS